MSNDAGVSAVRPGTLRRLDRVGGEAQPAPGGGSVVLSAAERDALLAGVTRLDRVLGAPMFAASLLFLVLIAGLVFSTLAAVPLAVWTAHLWGLAILYPLFLLEPFLHRAIDGRFCRQRMLYWLLPPLRIGGRDHGRGRSVWLPGCGWVAIDRELRRRVERACSVPMIVIALMVLPLLGAEYYFWSKQILPNPQLAIFLKLCESFIWLAFTVEFIVMFSIVDKRLRYCKEHWLDIAIIFLPLVGFLRVLRLGQVWRLHQLTRISRVYRLRGLSLRLFRGVVVLNVLDRFSLRKPEQRLKLLREAAEEKRYELQAIEAEIRELEQAITRKPDSL